MEINLGPLLAKQYELDARINNEHQVTHESTKSERVLALYVEIAELANASRVFKYWSLKGSEDRSRLLDEYADGLHFFLSLALVFNFKVETLPLPLAKRAVNHEIVKQFNTLFTFISELAKNEAEETYFHALQAFLNLGSALGFTGEDIINAYHAKLVVNYERQNTKY